MPDLRFPSLQEKTNAATAAERRADFLGKLERQKAEALHVEMHQITTEVTTAIAELENAVLRAMILIDYARKVQPSALGAISIDGAALAHIIGQIAAIARELDNGDGTNHTP